MWKVVVARSALQQIGPDLEKPKELHTFLKGRTRPGLLKSALIKKNQHFTTFGRILLEINRNLSFPVIPLDFGRMRYFSGPMLRTLIFPIEYWGFWSAISHQNCKIPQIPPILPEFNAFQWNFRNLQKFPRNFGVLRFGVAWAVRDPSKPSIFL